MHRFPPSESRLILWEMAAAEEILTRTLEKAGNIIDGVTCGAGMPY